MFRTSWFKHCAATAGGRQRSACCGKSGTAQVACSVAMETLSLALGSDNLRGLAYAAWIDETFHAPSSDCMAQKLGYARSAIMSLKVLLDTMHHLECTDGPRCFQQDLDHSGKQDSVVCITWALTNLHACSAFLNSEHAHNAH